MQPFSTWIEVDLDAIRNNIRRLGSITGRPVMAVIKANGYGHGLIEAGRAAETGSAAWLGVARLDEAVRLRQAGLQLPILVLGYCHPEFVPQALAHNITLTVHDPAVLPGYADQARSAGQPLPVHAKFDSGMGRLGVFTENGLEFVRQIHSYPELRLEGAFTHFASADDPPLKTTDWQIDRFNRLIEALEQNNMRPPLVHAANSAASLYFPRAYFDMVRSGIAIYGLQPSNEAPLPEGFQAALTWKALLVSVKILPAGHGVGYNHRYTTTKDSRIGVAAVGYADGVRRRLGNFALVGGKRVPVVGGMCMDQCMLLLDDVPSAQIGDEVVLIGRQGDAVITAEEVGAAWGTINYDVVCGLAARVPRLYHHE